MNFYFQKNIYHIVDSVIVHELAHLEVKDHSKAFWNKVGILDPKYKEHKDWLKNNGFRFPSGMPLKCTESAFFV